MTWSCLGVSITASSNLDILGVKFGFKLTFEEHVRGIVSRVSQIIGIFRLVKRIFVDTSVLLRFFLHLFFKSLIIVLRCGGQLLKVTFSFLSARCIRWPGFVPIRVYCCCVIDKVNSNSNHRLFNELPSASTRVRHTRAAAAVHPLYFEVSRCRTSHFAKSFLPAQIRLWNNLAYTVFDTRKLDWFNGAVNRWLLP